jgi:hypothetical protein
MKFEAIQLQQIGDFKNKCEKLSGDNRDLRKGSKSALFKGIDFCKISLSSQEIPV